MPLKELFISLWSLIACSEFFVVRKNDYGSIIYFLTKQYYYKHFQIIIYQNSYPLEVTGRNNYTSYILYTLSHLISLQVYDLVILFPILHTRNILTSSY